MWPGQTRKVEEDRLGVLDLGRGDGEGLGRCDRVRRNDYEDRYRSAWMRGRGGDLQGEILGFVLRNDNLVLHLFDPECGRHLHCVRVGVGGLGDALEEGDIGGPAAYFGGLRTRGDGEEGRLGNRLAVVGGTQHGVWIVKHGLGDRAGRDELAEVLRQSRRVGPGRGLADERDLVASADYKRRDVHFRNGWRACDAGGGR